MPHDAIVRQQREKEKKGGKGAASCRRPFRKWGMYAAGCRQPFRRWGKYAAGCRRPFRRWGTPAATVRDRSPVADCLPLKIDRFSEVAEGLETVLF